MSLFEKKIFWELILIEFYLVLLSERILLYCKTILNLETLQIPFQQILLFIKKITYFIKLFELYSIPYHTY